MRGAANKRSCLARASQQWYYDTAAFKKIPSTEWIDAIITKTNAIKDIVFVRMTLPSGASANARLHYTDIKDGWFTNNEDELKEGEQVKVRIVAYRHGGGQIKVAMKDPDNFPAFANVSESEWLDGEVVGVLLDSCSVKVIHPNGKDKAVGKLYKQEAGGLGEIEPELGLPSVVGEGDIVRVRVLGAFQEKGRWRMPLSTLNITEDGHQSKEDKGEMVVEKLSVDL